MSTIVLVTGGFDPIHTGHIAYFKNAKELYPHTPLCVGLNSDEWLIRKKGKFFLPMKERRAIVKELKPVDLTITYDDTDNSSCMAIYKCLQMYDKVVFCNGEIESTLMYQSILNSKRMKELFLSGVLVAMTR